MAYLRIQEGRRPVNVCERCGRRRQQAAPGRWGARRAAALIILLPKVSKPGLGRLPSLSGAILTAGPNYCLLCVPLAVKQAGQAACNGMLPLHNSALHRSG
jgi:hypothetical protein